MITGQGFNVVVIGGGPAGMMAAGQATLATASTILLEKTDAPGKKLSITGKKRCNLTNSAELEDFIDHFGPNGRFLRQAFHHYFREELIDFFYSLGVQTETERGGRIFPSNGDAAFVTKKVSEWVKKSGADIKLRSPVEKILIKNEKVSAVSTRDRQIHSCQAAILCTGGASFTGTGSTGDGYQMAQQLGHTITPLRPALVPLKTAGNIAQRMQGLSLRNINFKVFFDGKKRLEAFGEMLFTHFGISGPIVLTHSGEIVDALRAGKKATISIDLKPALDERKLDSRLLREIDYGGKQHFRTMLKSLLPSKMVSVCADMNHIPLDRPCHQISANERKRLLCWLKDLRLEVIGSLPIEAGMVTQGGVALHEVDPRTLMSKKIGGLFFAGEVLDLAADTGGFNLQAAFSTGWIAGRHSAAYINTLK